MDVLAEPVGGFPEHAVGEPQNDFLSWASVDVEGRPCIYGVAGNGSPAVFLHGWGMGAHAYKRPLRELARRGCRVYAPALPGFGGTADLPPAERSMDGYAAWLAHFLGAVGIAEPALLIGHSFGGGVATAFAHAHPTSVRYLVLLNAVGGGSETGAPTPGVAARDRPLRDWAWHFAREFFPPTRGLRMLATMSEDLLPNLVRNPRAMWEVGNLARHADLRTELEGIRELGMPVLVSWGDRDGVISLASFEAVCRAVGCEGRVVAGNHSWLLTDPDAFGEIMANVLEVAGAGPSVSEQSPRPGFK